MTEAQITSILLQIDTKISNEIEYDGHYSDTPLKWIILIGPQIVFNIEKLINNICEPIKIVHINIYTNTYPNNMSTE
jgi:cellobiose-specific phosphotransferase system component IIB